MMIITVIFYKGSTLLVLEKNFQKIWKVYKSRKWRIAIQVIGVAMLIKRVMQFLKHHFT